MKDTSGKAMKGATIKAMNKDAYPPQITSTTDDKGRWAMIGLRTGTWTFVVEAPGYTKQEAQWPVRVAGTVPMHFVLARDLGPIPGALTKNIQQQLAAANALRDKGQLDQALAAYEQIRDQNPKLTAVNLVVGQRVSQEGVARKPTPTARRALFDRAIASYTTMLSDESSQRTRQSRDRIDAHGSRKHPINHADATRRQASIRRWHAAIIITLFFVAVAGSAAVGWWYARESPAHQGPILLISIGGLPAAELASYGAERTDTPAIDALAQESIVFERAYTHSPQTLPAHASMLTGQLPPEHGVRDEAGFTLPLALARSLNCSATAASRPVLRCRRSCCARNRDCRRGSRSSTPRSPRSTATKCPRSNERAR